MSQDQNYPGYRGQLSQDAPTMAEILKPHGYATGIVGKWHQTYTGSSGQEQLFPLDRGFDFFYGTWWGAKNYFSPQYMMRDSEHISGVVYPEDYYLTDDLSAEAIDFVEAQIALEKPFYLYLAHYAPHKPFQAPADKVQALVDRYRAGYKTLQNERFARMQTLGVLPANAVVAAGMPAWDNLSSSGKEAWATEMATYAAMIEIMDDGIGQLIQVLKDNNQYDNTLILVLSDNGSAAVERSSTTLPMLSNTPCRSYKAHTLEGGIASPLIISWPEKLSALDGSVRHGPCHIIDILPTCLDAADLAFSSSFRGSTPVPPDGISLMPAVKGTPLPERPLFWEHLGRRAVYQEGWKLVTDSVNDPWKLYYLADDPTEQQTLTAVYPDRVITLETLWDSWATTDNVVPGPNTWP
jgi:arylsulfatase